MRPAGGAGIPAGQFWFNAFANLASLALQKIAPSISGLLDSNRGNHPAGAALASVAEEKVGTASRTQTGHGNVGERDTGAGEDRAVSCHQIETRSGRGWGVS